MHKARHTAGQRVLDATGNLKATQKLLGRASIQTTGDFTPTGTSTSAHRPVGGKSDLMEAAGIEPA
jgi:hypothetical protein